MQLIVPYAMALCYNTPCTLQKQWRTFSAIKREKAFWIKNIIARDWNNTDLTESYIDNWGYGIKKTLEHPIKWSQMHMKTQNIYLEAERRKGCHKKEK